MHQASKNTTQGPVFPLLLIMACQSEFCPMGTEWDGSSCHVVLCSVAMENGDGTCIDAPEYVGDDTDDTDDSPTPDSDSDTTDTDTPVDSDTPQDTTYLPDTSFDTGWAPNPWDSASDSPDPWDSDSDSPADPDSGTDAPTDTALFDTGTFWTCPPSFGVQCPNSGPCYLECSG